jgi:hypothetical protein
MCTDLAAGALDEVGLLDDGGAVVDPELPDAVVPGVLKIVCWPDGLSELHALRNNATMAARATAIPVERARFGVVTPPR